MYRLNSVSVLPVLNTSNGFAGGRLFTMNNLPPVTCTTRPVGGLETHAGFYVKY